MQADMDKERVSACSSEESILSKGEVTVEADSDGEEQVLLRAGQL